ncbi:MAG: hypothetical protein LBC35_01545 [Coriobacteriales bacterium]|jgi:pilin isopeptide linkage protein|nr:hypothetical protein [Coriobacteriales bacterium]
MNDVTQRREAPSQSSIPSPRVAATTPRTAQSVRERVICAALVLAIALFAGLYTPFAVAATSGQATLSVTQNITAPYVASAPSDEFTYLLAPRQPNNPLPAKNSARGYEFSLRGTSSITFAPITFTQPGIYTYELSTITDAQDNYSYDRQVYVIEIYVDNALGVLVVAYKDNGDKTAVLSYTHTYTARAATVPGTSGTPSAFVSNPPVSSDSLVGNQAQTMPVPDERASSVVQDITDGRIPLGDFSDTSVWSMLNLLLMLLGVCVFVWMLAAQIKSRMARVGASDHLKRSEGADSVVMPVPEVSGYAQGAASPPPPKHVDPLVLTVTRCFAAVFALAFMVPWFIFEDTNRPMAWLDAYTPVFIVLFIVMIATILLYCLVRRKARADHQYHSDQP